MNGIFENPKAKSRKMRLAIFLALLSALAGCKEPTKEEFMGDKELQSEWVRKCAELKEQASTHEGCSNLHRVMVGEAFDSVISTVKQRAL